MDRVQCPKCGYRVGLGITSEPGTCPSCGLALMYTCEFRALDEEDLLAESRRRAGLERGRQPSS
jgi:hypothetical protein